MITGSCSKGVMSAVRSYQVGENQLWRWRGIPNALCFLSLHGDQFWLWPAQQWTAVVPGDIQGRTTFLMQICGCSMWGSCSRSSSWSTFLLFLPLRSKTSLCALKISPILALGFGNISFQSLHFFNEVFFWAKSWILMGFSLLILFLHALFFGYYI